MMTKRQSERRPYEAPQLKKQENLKDITLFTSFGP
jgi:hypothetical protein